MSTRLREHDGDARGEVGDFRDKGHVLDYDPADAHEQHKWLLGKQAKHTGFKPTREEKQVVPLPLFGSPEYWPYFKACLMGEWTKAEAILGAYAEQYIDWLFSKPNPRMTYSLVGDLCEDDVVTKAEAKRRRLAKELAAAALKPRTCVMCGNPTNKRRDAKTCSDACRRALSRQEKREAAKRAKTASKRTRAKKAPRNAIHPYLPDDEMVQRDLAGRLDASIKHALTEVPFPLTAATSAKHQADWTKAIIDVLAAMASDEMRKDQPQPEIFTRRARAYIEQLRDAAERF